MFRIVRPRSMILLGAAVVVGGAALPLALLSAWAIAQIKGSGDPDLRNASVVSVCSDVEVHARVTVDVGTAARPDLRKADYDVEATGHDRDPYALTRAAECGRAAGDFGSRVELEAPGLDDDRPFYVTAPADNRHVLVVRLTRHADGTVTSAQELLAAR